MEKTNRIIPEIPEAHPLKAIVQEKKIPYWMLARMIGSVRSECWISRALNGIQPMPLELERKLTDALSRVQVEGGR